MTCFLRIFLILSHLKEIMQSICDDIFIPNLKSSNYRSTTLLPYIQDVTDGTGKILESTSSELYSSPPRKCHKPLLCIGIKSMPCSCGAVYTGETSRSYRTPYQIKSSASQRQPHINAKSLSLLDNISVLAKVDTTCKFREATEISKHPNNLNREDENHYLSIWNSIT